MNMLNNCRMTVGCVFALTFVLGTASVIAQAQSQAQDHARRGAVFVSDLGPIYQELLDAQRRCLAVTNDAEWQVISPKLGRVIELRLQAHSDEVLSLFSGTEITNSGGGSLTGTRFRKSVVFTGQLPAPSPEVRDALRAAQTNQISLDEIKTAVAKLRERKVVMAKAQADLRAVVTPQQADILVLRGMLE